MNKLGRNTLLAATGALLLGFGTLGWADDKPKPKGPPLGPPVTSQGEVNALLLDDRGAVRGLVLANGDQIRFSPGMGDQIKTLVKPGDKISVTGHAGKPSEFGRALQAAEIKVGDQVIKAAPPPNKPHEAPPKPLKDVQPSGAKNQEPPPPPTEAQAKEPPRAPNDNVEMSALEEDAQSQGSYAPSEPLEALSASGTVKIRLINSRGDLDGLILSGGEQIQFGPKEGQQVMAAVKGKDVSVSVEGHGLRNDLGTIIRADKLTVGDKSFDMAPLNPPPAGKKDSKG